MQTTSRWKTFYLTHWAKPASDRTVYRAILDEKFGRIVELGIGDGGRALRMIDAAARHAGQADLHYVGVDSFEARGPADGAPLPLIEAYRLLKQSGAKIKLIPGEPCDALVRSANSLGKIDLLLISSNVDAESQSRLWFFVPRLLHERSLVLRETADAKGEKIVRPLDRAEIARLAAGSPRRKAA